MERRTYTGAHVSHTGSTVSPWILHFLFSWEEQPAGGSPHSCQAALSPSGSILPAPKRCTPKCLQSPIVTHLNKALQGIKYITALEVLCTWSPDHMRTEAGEEAAHKVPSSDSSLGHARPSLPVLTAYDVAWHRDVHLHFAGWEQAQSQVGAGKPKKTPPDWLERSTVLAFKYKG